MNRVFEQVDLYMHEALEKELPDIKSSDLEKGGAVFYMNGKNGTAFDWYVNEHLPCFFIFYNDKENLGAVKATLYTDGGMSIYVYADHGHAEPEQYEVKLDVDDGELLELAALLTENADSRRVWDEDIRTLNADGLPDDAAVKSFASLEEAHKPMIEQRKIYPKTAIVSRKVREEGRKIGYGMRAEPTNDKDSGWFFGVGDESDEYINNPDNLELWSVNSVVMLDSALSEFITSPYGTLIVRVAPDRFELDAPGKEMYLEE